MADTIEAFVAKLKSEGVEQGKLDADQIRSQAQQEAEKIVADSKSQAEKIIIDAQKQSDDILARGRTELQLASRDAILKLNEAIDKALRTILEAQVETQLRDAQFIKEVIRTIVQRFIDADIDSYAPVKIDVSPEMRQQLCDWAINELRVGTKNDAGGLDFRDTLRQAGFEFSLHGATIEVTRDSVVDTFMQLVSPHLRQMIKQANESREGI